MYWFLICYLRQNLKTKNCPIGIKKKKKRVHPVWTLMKMVQLGDHFSNCRVKIESYLKTFLHKRNMTRTYVIYLNKLEYFVDTNVNTKKKIHWRSLLNFVYYVNTWESFFELNFTYLVFIEFIRNIHYALDARSIFFSIFIQIFGEIICLKIPNPLECYCRFCAIIFFVMWSLLRLDVGK